jgi:3-oxoadipate enol-lactonase
VQLESEATGKGTDLVLLHSLLAERSSFAQLVPELARSSRVHVVSLPGYGNSPSANETSIEQYADRVASFLEEQRFQKPPTILGNGFGGFIAVALAIRHGARLGALIAAPALAAFPAEAKAPFRVLAEKVRAGGMAAVLDAAIARMLPPAFAAAHPESVAERKRALAAADPQSFARACGALAALDFTASLSKIKNRTLVIAGALDQTTPANLARELAAGIPGAQFRELPGCGHCPQLEQPAQLARAISEFLIDARNRVLT